MSVKWTSLGISLILAVVLPGILGKRLSGHLTTGSTVDWKFMTRFCFISLEGRFDFYFEYKEEYANQDILLYYDDIWLPVYTDPNLNCSEKKSTLSYKDGQIVTLSPSYTDKCQNFKKEDGSTWINCSDFRQFRTARERWWFFVLAKCGSKRGVDLHYRLHMTNGDDLLTKEFSAEEFYILPIDVTFFLLVLSQLSMSIYVAVKLVSKQLYHTTYKIYMASLGFYTFHMFLQTVAYGKYANDGLPDSFFKTKLAGRLFEAISRLLFLILLILMAKGYTITRGRLSQSGSIKLAIFMTVYTILYAVVFVWEALFFDEGKVLYFYESVPGYCIIGLRVLSWVWFLYAVFFTVKHYPEKWKFYIPFSVFYTMWFWASPVVIIIALTAMAKWTREKTVVGVECFIAFLGFLFFLIFTWPSVANKHFPFHVRTSQIDVIGNAPHIKEDEMGFPEENDSQSSGAAFKLSDNDSTSGPNFTDLFVVSHTRSKPDRYLEGKSRHGQLPPLDHRARIPTAPRYPDDESSPA